ncbi:hypothetical protein F0562_019518 [Nyssa sinensis]|uniref:Uncharacterized protein n=1 Tax=Nyssa sinensis TaxID=561372 RepID=A0A5J5BPM0_9ASTE|nr:hypothetical protein F0562_019518 [Nyssa sinensis]
MALPIFLSNAHSPLGDLLRDHSLTKVDNPSLDVDFGLEPMALIDFRYVEAANSGPAEAADSGQAEATNSGLA